MIKKISNWTFGSIFRTIGRFVAYLIIGIIIALFFVKKEYVKADSYYASYDESYYYNESKTQPLESGGTFQYDTRRSKQHLTDNADFVKYYFSNNLNIDHLKGGHITIPFSLETGAVIDDHTTYTQIVCQNWRTESYGYSCQGWAYVDSKDAIVLQPQVSFNVYIEYTSGYVDNCEVDYEKNYFSCPIINATGLNIKSLIVAQKVYYAENYDMYYKLGLGLKFNGWKNDTQTIIENQNQNHNESMNYFNSTISGEVNGTGENGTITDSDAESNSCGIICKLKHLIKMLSIDNIKYLVIPTETQMNDLFEQMQEKITSKLGILGLPVTVYTRLMQIAMQYEEGTQNWCIQWDAVQVPNFEDFNIIQAGNYCFSDMLQNQKINTFRNTCQMIIGGLILLSFIQYLFNCLHRILDVPIQDNYEYFTTEDVYGIDTTTGEVQSHQIKSRTTTRRPL